MPRTHEEKLISESDAKGEAETYTKKLNDVVPTNDISLPLNEESSKSSRKMNHKTGKWPDSLPLWYERCRFVAVEESVPYLTEDILYEIIDECEEHNCFSRLIRTLGEVYSSIESLSRSFLEDVSSPLDTILDKAGGKYLLFLVL